MELSEDFAQGSEMGGDMARIEPSKIEDNVRKSHTWMALKEGGMFPFMEAIVVHDNNCSS